MYKYTDISPVPPFPEGEPRFVNELRKYSRRQPHWQDFTELPAGMTDLRNGWKIDARFPDPDGVLTSAYDALERFKAAYIKKSGGELAIIFQEDKSFEFEEYTIDVSDKAITITAGDTEGIRRAVYALLDMIRGNAIAALEQEKIHRKAWLKNRISRCFFGPIKRPPFFRDELTDDIDYYPEAYLDLLASEGVNGIWLTVVWKELAQTGFFPEDPLRAKRIEKLKRTVEKCRKYGIKVWIFCIEPASWRPANPLPAGYEDMRGEATTYGGYEAFCIASENSQRYIRETSASIFRDVPHLGGMMLISLGERPTSCLSYVYDVEGGKNPCADKCGLSNSQILNKVLSSIKAGIRDAGSDAEVLSWLYCPNPVQVKSWWFDLPLELDNDKILAFNFESGCTRAQTGKIHAGGDYWLSAIGPSDRFGRIAAAAKGNCQFAAKMQVGCSHELATVPFMPVPGNLHQKYKAMKQLGVQHVIQCWYFGNYPGVMNRAAGLLAYEDFDKGDEKSFLIKLARPEWGEKMAEKIAEMWMKFGEAYSNYPLNIQFQYYGPMHDGIVWPLHVKQVFKSMPRSWKPDNFPAGDAIGEALVNHDLADVEILTGIMAKRWNEAMSLLPELRKQYAGDPDRQRDCDLYEALQLLINSGAHIMNFYHLRTRLHAGNKAVIPAMIKLAEQEKIASTRMAQLCEDDCRLGYHSEAEVYKYFPAKLLWRAAELDKTIAALRELQEMSENEICQELKWEGVTLDAETEYAAETFRWSVKQVDEELHFKIKYFPIPGENSQEMRLIMLMDKSGLKLPLVMRVATGGESFSYCNLAQGSSITDLGNDEFLVKVPWGRLEYAPEIFTCVQRIWQDGKQETVTDNFPPSDYQIDPRLNFNGHAPERYGLLVL